MGVKISELTNVASLTGSEEFPIVQGETTKKTTISQITGATDISAEMTYTAESGVTVSDFFAYKVSGLVIMGIRGTKTSGSFSTGNNKLATFTGNYLPVFSVFGAGRELVGSSYYGTSGQFMSSGVCQVFANRSSVTELRMTAIYVPTLPEQETRGNVVQTRSANSGELVGSGERGNLLLNDLETIERENEESTPIEEPNSNSGEVMR